MSNRLDQPGDTDAGSDDHARTRARDVARSEGVSNLQALQRVLYRSAKQDPTRRFHALYDKLTRSDVMWPEAVKANETSFFQTFCISASWGSLIHATVGSFGGVGRPANRDGLAA